MVGSKSWGTGGTLLRCGSGLPRLHGIAKATDRRQRRRIRGVDLRRGRRRTSQRFRFRLVAAA
eukprot:2023110-Alexandrium_andersonii.AAC.1